MISRGRSKVGIVKYDWAGVIRLGLRLIFGFNYGWQIRCSIDVVLFLCTLSFVARAIPWLRLAFILLAGIYIAIVFASKHSRNEQQKQKDAVNSELERLARSFDAK
jgi:hypothetical protein